MEEEDGIGEEPDQGTQDSPNNKKKMKKKANENDAKTKSQSKIIRQSCHEAQAQGYSDSSNNKKTGLDDTEKALMSITVKVRNKLLLSSSTLVEGGWYDQVHACQLKHSNRTHSNGYSNTVHTSC